MWDGACGWCGMWWCDEEEADGVAVVAGECITASSREREDMCRISRYLACWARMGRRRCCVEAGRERNCFVKSSVRAPAAIPAPRPFGCVFAVSELGCEDDGVSVRRNSAAAIFPHSMYQPVTSEPFLQHWWMNL